MTVASLLTRKKAGPSLFFTPEPLVDGHEPESRFVFCGMSWEVISALTRRSGDDRPSPRFDHLDGELEVMSTSEEPERIKNVAGRFHGNYSLRLVWISMVAARK